VLARVLEEVAVAIVFVVLLSAMLADT